MLATILGSIESRPPDFASLSAHQPLFALLAPEIMEEIFLYACPSVSVPMAFDSCVNPAPPGTARHRLRYVDPITLAMVCQDWRAMTIALHSMWATISIETSKISLQEWTRWGLFQLRDRLQRSGSRRLEISINSAHYGRDNGAISAILDVVVSHSERWSNVEFIGFSLMKFSEKFNLLSAPSLKTLGISATGVGDLRNIPMPWGQITDVTLDTKDLRSEEAWHKILSSLPVSITALTFLKPAYFDNSRKRPLITLPKLQRLRFLMISNGVLDMLICPSLQQLDITLGNAFEITRFLTNSSSPRLIHIHLHLEAPKEGGYGDILLHASLSQVKTISLGEINYPVLDLLVFDSRNLFSCLETIFLDLSQWTGLDRHSEEIRAGSEKLQQILDSRISGAHWNYYETFPERVRCHFTRNHNTSPVRKFSAHLFGPPQPHME